MLSTYLQGGIGLLQLILTLKYPLFLVLAVSIDSFAAALAYGSSGIRIPILSSIIMNGICSLILAASLFLGYLIFPVIPENLTKIICCLILSIIGIAKLCDSSIKVLIRRNKSIRRQIKFSLSSLHFILNIYADPEEADCDQSKSISIGEAAVLAVALSLDGTAVGFGAGLGGIDPLITALLCFAVGMAAVKVGSLIGEKIAHNSSRDFSWISGVLLLLIAFLNL
jgi:putative sporulation protein YtaF